MGSCCAEKIPRRSRTSGRRTTHKGRSGRRSPAGPCEAAQRWSTKARRRRMLHPLQCSPVLGCAAADEDKGAPEAPARTRDGRAARCRGVRRTQPPALSSRLIASVTPNGASAHPSCRLCSCSRSIVLDVVAGGTASITAAHRAGAPSRLGTRPCVAARPGCADQKQHAPPPPAASCRPSSTPSIRSAPSSCRTARSHLLRDALVLVSDHFHRPPQPPRPPCPLPRRCRTASPRLCSRRPRPRHSRSAMPLCEVRVCRRQPQD
jgi:hypothetical protein